MIFPLLLGSTYFFKLALHNVLSNKNKVNATGSKPQFLLRFLQRENSWYTFSKGHFYTTKEKKNMLTSTVLTNSFCVS